MARKQSLSAQLAATATNLRNTQDQKKADSAAFVTAAAQAAAESELAATHAAAVEQALDILDKAGVPV